MHIAIVSPWAISETSVGGTERFTVDLATQLQALGNTIEVFMLSGRSRHVGGIQFTSLNILGEGRAANEYDLRAFADGSQGESLYGKWADYLQAHIDISKFDAVQLNSLLFIDAWKDKPRMFTIHTNPFEYQLDWGQNSFDHAVQKIRLELPDRTLLAAPSEHYAKLYSRLFAREVLPIPHAIDTMRLAPTTTTRTKHGNITILLPSRLEPVQKRPQIVFEGVAQLPEGARKRITIVASGKDKQYSENFEKLQRIAKHAGFSAQCTRFRSMSEAYALADIVALPSKSESFGYAALESLALGIPTILNDIPTFKEIGTGNANAHFFAHTAEAFSHALSAVLQDVRRQPADSAWTTRYDVRKWAETYQQHLRSITSHA